MNEDKKEIVLDGHKLLYHLDRVKAWLAGEKVAPITIDCSLSRKCTYNCVYCYGKLQGQEDERMLSRETIFNFLDDAAEIGVKAVSFVSDGESTCCPYLYDAIVHGKKNGIDMALGTNGYLLKDDRLEEILPSLTYLRFNISAAEQRRYTQIHGCKEKCFDKVVNTIKKCVAIKEKNQLAVTIGLQTVLLPNFLDQVIPLAKLGKELGVDYLVIKHCTDDERGSLGVDYSQYTNQELTDILKEAEGFSTDRYLVKAKWSKLMTGRKRGYIQCYGPPFLLQISGSGLVAPCGSFFNDRYKKFHIGNIIDTRFKDLWKSDRYQEVMNYLSSNKFDARKDCACLCLQDKVNEFLWELKQGKIRAEDCKIPDKIPGHVNFI